MHVHARAATDLEEGNSGSWPLSTESRLSWDRNCQHASKSVAASMMQERRLRGPPGLAQMQTEPILEARNA